MEPLNLREYLNELSYVRTVDFSNTYRTSGQEPLLELDTLLRWKLVELDLSRSSINPETIVALGEYLKNSQSTTLRHLRMNQCGLTGGAVDDLLRAMTLSGPRQLHLEISGNHLEQEQDRLIKVIGESLTPTHMTMEMLEYKEEKNFRRLVRAWTGNTSTTHLDISKVSLPSEPSTETIAALERMLAENRALESLDIAGEEAHLEVANFGSGLNRALMGLKWNRSLKILHVEHQKLGMVGANTLASILEENTPLRELHCAGNGFSLQAFTVIVCSLYENTNLLYLPAMDEDRAAAMKNINKEIDVVQSGIRSLTIPTKAIVKRSIEAAMPGQRSFSSRQNEAPLYPKRLMTEEDLGIVRGSISDGWNRQLEVLRGYLGRNYKLAQGLPAEGLPAAENERPSTGRSGGTSEWLDLGSNDTTPMGELDRQLETEKLSTTTNNSTEAPEEENDEIEEALMMTEKLKFG